MRIILDCPAKQMVAAFSVAQTALADYENMKPGRHKGAIWGSRATGLYFYAYRSKTGLVVMANETKENRK